MAKEFIDDITAMSNGEIKVEMFYSSAGVKSAETCDASTFPGEQLAIVDIYSINTCNYLHEYQDYHHADPSFKKSKKFWA